MTTNNNQFTIHNSPFTILRFDSIGSTNDEALRQAKLGANEGLCVVAREQTTGRGRQRRAWHSPKDAGLYLSVILRPRFEQKFWSLITLAAAIAVCDALKQSCDLTVDVKWPNDIHTATGKKLAGILAETVDSAVVLGVGVNLLKSAVAPELLSIAGSLEDETGIAQDAETVLASLLENLRKYYQILHDSDGRSVIIQEYEQRSSYARGKKVRVTLENEIFEGTTRGLEPDGALRVAVRDNLIKKIYAGDVVAVRSQNN